MESSLPVVSLPIHSTGSSLPDLLSDTLKITDDAPYTHISAKQYRKRVNMFGADENIGDSTRKFLPRTVPPAGGGRNEPCVLEQQGEKER